MLTAILPNYNHGRFLERAIEGLAKQTRPAEEIIIIDDASTDDSIAVIESWLPLLPNARLLRNSANLGVVRNMNIGLEMAHGTEVVFVAADDLTYPTFFERLLALLDHCPYAAFASAQTDIIDSKGNRMGKLQTPAPLAAPGYIGPKAAAALLMRDDAWFTGNATIFRRKSLQAVGGFPEELGALTDGYVSRLLAVTNGACYTPEVLVAWRRLDSGFAWKSAMDRKQTRALAERAESLLRAQSAHFAPGYPERWMRRYIFGAARFALANARRQAQYESPVRFALALIREIIGSTWLFATLRPQDTFTVLHRHLTNKL